MAILSIMSYHNEIGYPHGLTEKSAIFWDKVMQSGRSIQMCQRNLYPTFHPSLTLPEP